MTSIDTKDQYFESVRLKNTLPFSVLAFARHTVESVRSRKAGERGKVRRCQGTWGHVGLRRDSGFPPGWERKALSGSK